MHTKPVINAAQNEYTKTSPQIFIKFLILQFFPCPRGWGEKNSAVTFHLSPQCQGFSRTVMDEKSLSPLFPVGKGGGGAGGGEQWIQMTGA